MKLNLKRTAIIAALSVFGTLFPAPADAANFLGVFFKIYGRASQIFPISIEDGTTTKWYVGTDFAAGDCKISQDGGALANTTNLPAQISGNQYTWTITAAEMATHVILITCTDVSATAWKDFAFRIETVLNVGQIVADYSDSATNSAGFFIRGTGTSAGIDAQGGATGEGAKFVGGSTSGQGMTLTGSASGAGLGIVGGATGIGVAIDAGASGATGLQIRSIAGNNDAVSIVGAGTGVGLGVTGGASGNGVKFYGGGTTGVGLEIKAQGGNNDGMSITGFGTGVGLGVVGGTSGNGARFYGGATTGVGFEVKAQGGNNDGMSVTGVGTGVGIGSTGGTSGNGGRFTGGATTGVGLQVNAQGGNNNGATFTGIGTGSGLAGVGGATGNGLVGTSSSTGYGLYVTGATAVLGHNLFEVPYTDITGAPVADTTTVREAMGGLMARFYNKVTQTATLQSIFKTDSVTTATTCVTSDDGTTQTKGKCN